MQMHGSLFVLPGDRQSRALGLCYRICDSEGICGLDALREEAPIFVLLNFSISVNLLSSIVLEIVSTQGGTCVAAACLLDSSVQLSQPEQINKLNEP
uniref:Uncharacterized protein n=1 Tax=Aegilops tauschii subsp. strangulata TaxID=200361 RepID=A0A453MRG3_AEGTS